MPTSTTNYELIKPGTDDPILIEQLNTNADIIDNALKENADALGGKVDKETGKGLSTNDFTTAEKTKLDDLAEIKSIGTGLNLDDNGELTATGGGGGTSDYSDLTNKPQINSVTLSGNKSLSDLGITYESETAASGGTALSLVTTGEKYAWNNKQNTISDLSTIRSGAALGATAVQPETGKGLSTNDYTTAEKTKLAGIAEGAEVNVQSDWEQTDNTADDYIKGKPTIPTVNDSTITIQKNGTTVKSFTTNQASGDTIDITVPTSAADVSAIPTSAKGTASGVAELDSNGKVPSSQLPSYVDDVIEGYYYNGKFYEESAHTTEITGETGKIYIDLSGTNKTYRWSGSGYTEISESLALGETSSTAYRGDRGKTAYYHATESRLTTATESGLYKVASTAEGHIASLTSVQKSDITALGIPTQDTTYTFEGTYNASTNKAATMADIKDGKLTGYTQGSGNVAATDKVVEAIGKVEKKADDNKNNISMLTADMSKVQTGLGAVCVLRSNKSSSTTYTYTMSIDDFSVPPSISIGSSGTYLVSILTWSTTPTYSMYTVSYSGGDTTTYNLVQKIAGADANVTCTDGVITITSSGKVQIYALR